MCYIIELIRHTEEVAHATPICTHVLYYIKYLKSHCGGGLAPLWSQVFCYRCICRSSAFDVTQPPRRDNGLQVSVMTDRPSDFVCKRRSLTRASATIITAHQRKWMQMKVEGVCVSEQRYQSENQRAPPHLWKWRAGDHFSRALAHAHSE